MKALPAPARDFRLIEIQQDRHAAEHVGRRRDHARPHRPLLLKAVERTRIIVEALGEELHLLPLCHGIAVLRRVHLRTQREVRRMAGHAERGLLMHVGHAI